MHLREFSQSLKHRRQQIFQISINRCFDTAGNKVSSIFIQPDEVTGFFQYFQRNISNVGTICK